MAFPFIQPKRPYPVDFDAMGLSYLNDVPSHFVKNTQTSATFVVRPPVCKMIRNSPHQEDVVPLLVYTVTYKAARPKLSVRLVPLWLSRFIGDAACDMMVPEYLPSDFKQQIELPNETYTIKAGANNLWILTLPWLPLPITIFKSLDSVSNNNNKPVLKLRVSLSINKKACHIRQIQLQDDGKHALLMGHLLSQSRVQHTTQSVIVKPSIFQPRSLSSTSARKHEKVQVITKVDSKNTDTQKAKGPKQKSIKLKISSKNSHTK